MDENRLYALSFYLAQNSSNAKLLMNNVIQFSFPAPRRLHLAWFSLLLESTHTFRDGSRRYKISCLMCLDMETPPMNEKDSAEWKEGTPRSTHIVGWH